MKNMKCSITNCENKHKARGYCKKHYSRWQKTGDPLKTLSGRKAHGLSHIPEYIIWCSMKKRCLSKNCNLYLYYGGRGITICDKWKNSFSAFYQDMGPRPIGKYTLERIDNNKGYSPENVIWATWNVNSQNKRTTKLDVNKVQCIRDWYRRKICTKIELAFEFKVSVNTVNGVLYNTRWRNVT